MTDQRSMSRRKLLKWAAGTTAASLITPQAFASTQELAIPLPDAKSIKLINTHTGEKTSVTFWEGGRYHMEALAEINKILRDHRQNEITEMDIKLIDKVHEVTSLLDTNHWVQVISGYRSPKTNAMLQAAGRNVATNSMHTVGKAIDIWIPGFDINQLHKAALKTRCGGVGKYSRSQFVHMDTGRVRTWGA